MTESSVYDVRDLEVRGERGMVVVTWTTATGRCRLRLNATATAFLAADLAAAAREADA